MTYVANGKQVLCYQNGSGAPIHIADAGDNEKAHFLATMANAPKGEDGGPIVVDSFDYVAEATLTLSNQFHGELVSRRIFVNRLNRAIDALNELDAVKKSLFYGKDNGLMTDVSGNVSDLPNMVAGIFGVNDNLTMREAEDFIHGTIGLATEAGELLELLRDTMNGKPLDRANLQEEIGDGKWYMAILAKVGRFVWGDDEKVNIAKLRTRFPNAFTEYDANNRNLAAERVILEGDGANQLPLPMASNVGITPGAIERYEANGGYLPGESANRVVGCTFTDT